jgi:acyl-coenzyme A thioesterase PaaI-like protein
MKKPLFLRFINVWPPMLGAGIRVHWLDSELRAVDVSMKLRRWNTNAVGTHYGGSLYSMADPFYMLMLIHNLGREYIVWDKAATIRFRKPGRGKVTAKFRLKDEELADIRTRMETLEKYEPTFRVEIRDEAGELIAEVEKLVYIRKKQPKAAAVS